MPMDQAIPTLMEEIDRLVKERAGQRRDTADAETPAPLGSSAG
jgi:hypothetical protein